MSRQTDSVYNERKLKPIYDFLDNGYYKKALQDIDKLLKKTKDWQYAKVLKALSLIRLQRQKEGIDILNEIVQQVPTDESTLQTMSLCYRELRQNEMIVTIYENALKKDPAREQLHINLFMAYARQNDYKKQQLTALNLYKVHPKNTYYFWAVMSIYMQANCSNDQTIASKITLPLAAKMCQKFFADNKFQQEAELELYLMILEKQKQYDTMVQLIDSPLGKQKLRDDLGFVSMRKAQCLRLEGKHEQAFDLLEELIKAHPDQYNYYIDAFNSAIALDESTNELKYTLRLFDLIEHQCNAYQTQQSFQSSNESESEKPKATNVKRGPYMAKIVISQLLLQSIKEQQGDTDRSQQLVGKYDCLTNECFITDALCNYFDLFGSKYVCVKDMFFLFQTLNLPRNQVLEFLAKIKLSLLSLGNENSIIQVTKSLIYHYLEHHFSELEREWSEKEAEVELLWQLHLKVLASLKNATLNKEATTESETEPTANSGSGGGGDKDQQQSFDPAIYLIVNKMTAGLDIYLDEKASGPVLNVLALLEYSLRITPNDFYCKLFLVRLYNSLGAGHASFGIFQTLDIKLIQNDTLGHYFLPAFLSTGLFSYAQQFLNASWKFYSFNFKETPDFIINCYKYCSFIKIEEINEFNKKLRKSLQYHYTFIERFYLNLLTDCKNHLAFTTLVNDGISHVVNGNLDVDWNDIGDNRDLFLLSPHHFEVHAYLRNHLNDKTFADEILWLRYRYLLLRTIINAQHLSENLLGTTPTIDNDHCQETSSSSVENADVFSVENFVNLIRQLEELSALCNSVSKENSAKYCLEGPAPSRLQTYFVNGYSNYVLSLLNYLLELFQYCSKSNVNIPTFSLDMPTMLAQLKTTVSALNANQSLCKIRRTLEELTDLTEIVSVCISLFGVSQNFVQKALKPGKKSKRRKSTETVNLKENEQVLAEVNRNLTVLRDYLEECLKALLSICATGNITERVDLFLPNEQELLFLSQMEVSIDVKASIKSKIVSSYQKSFLELTTVLQAKQKYLASLSQTQTTSQNAH